MNDIKKEAMEILEIAKNIYQIQENNNPNVIFGDKIFMIGTNEDPEAVSVKRNCEQKDRSYYFENPEIEGVIIKKENGNYCIKACVKYTNDNNQKMWFAKIRIEPSFDGDIQIMGTWSGSWQQSDYEDEDQSKSPNSDLPNALVSMTANLTDIYTLLCQNIELNSDLYNPEWVKKLKIYNK